MKKGNATLIFVTLIGFTALTWYSTINTQIQNAEAYEEYIKTAESLEKKEIYKDALENYRKASELNPKNYDLILKMADVYYKVGDYNGFISSCDKAITLKPEMPEPYVRKAEVYISKLQYDDAIKVINIALKATGENEEIQKLKDEIATKTIEKYVSFSSIGDWHIQGDVNYVPVEENEKWGMAVKDGSKKIRPQYDYIGVYDETAKVIPCLYEGKYYYIDLGGNKKLVADVEYEFLGSFGNGYAPAQRDGKFGYIDTEFKENKFEYDYAGAFANNVAAVMKDGKWALINSELKEITGFDYDEVLVDSYGFCASYEVIIVRQGEKYFFVNHEGKKIEKNGFDGARLPAANDAYIAVKQGDLWGYANSEGKVELKPAFEDAKSFSMGLAPVKVEDNWGYINSKGELVIKAVYSEAGVFSADGSAPIKTSNRWNFIVLCEYDN